MTLGRFSLQTFMPGARISSAHGTIRPVDPATGAADASAMALYHPAAAFRQAALRETLFEDIAGAPDALIRSRQRRAEHRLVPGAAGTRSVGRCRGAPGRRRTRHGRRCAAAGRCPARDPTDPPPSLLDAEAVPSEFSAIEPAPVDASIAADPHDVPATLEHDAPAADDFEPMAHAVVVTLFGGVEVGSADGTVATWERSKTVELIAWLATHRSHSTRAATRTALWELDVRDATFANVVSEARRGAGPPRATARRRGVVGAHAHRAAPAAPVGGEPTRS